MKAFTIGTGAPEYVALARVAAISCEWATGMQCEILAPAGDPWRAKLEIPCGEQYLFVDADAVFLRQWAPDVRTDHFAAVIARRREGGLAKMLKGYPAADPRRFFNTGIFIAHGTHHAAVMQRAWEMFDQGFSKLGEETVLNLALQELSAPVTVLPNTLCRHWGYNRGEVVAHVARQRTVERKLEEIRRLVAAFAPADLRARLVPVLGDLRVVSRVRRSKASPEATSEQES